MSELTAILWTVILVGSIVMGVGILVANLIILRACQKMYTEYFKDRSMGNHSQSPEAMEQPE